MALVDDIEFFGRAVDAGEMTRGDATKALTKASGGGLTDRGAGSAIDKWQTVRAQYRQTMTDSARLLDKIYGLDT